MIELTGLGKSYRSTVALDEVTLRVTAGVIFGYVGPNGAGKTTTIRILAGLMRPTRGSARICGADTVRERKRAQRNLGYLPGQFVAYPDLTAEQYLGYLAHLHGGVDPKVRRGIADRLDLDVTTRIGAMSHGNRQKVGIVAAFMTEPPVVLLDEPTSGLDPLVQREFLAMAREVRDSGRTVFLSSHVLSEVEAVADTVGMLRKGRLIEVRSVAEFTGRTVRHLDLTFAGPAPAPTVLRDLPGVRHVYRGPDRHRVEVEMDGSTAELVKAIAPYDVIDLVSREPDLEEVFLGYYGQD
ncbi:ATP-binding cassette domain-containing protein [Nocardia rhamnosiphila]|uniref:ABC transporter ATP-binding protein n=1 Tax=Nocardia rhamnosiphila TaxID=426716 RepID=A0ABV2WN97_9NOCA|nr:ABC transporter ATP-binding protein [Nocardia rhamnosiphila]